MPYLITQIYHYFLCINSAGIVEIVVLFLVKR